MENDCKRTAIFKQTSESLPDACLSPYDIPLFCQGLLVGLFVKCRQMPSVFYENMLTNYIEWSLFQDQLPWIEEVIGNSSIKLNIDKYPKRKNEKKIIKSSEGKVETSSIKFLEKFILPNSDNVDLILNDKTLKHKGALFKMEKNAFLERIILNGGYEETATTENVDIRVYEPLKEKIFTKCEFEENVSVSLGVYKFCKIVETFLENTSTSFLKYLTSNFRHFHHLKT